MDADPRVSSLYGPGLFVGRVCTMASVLLSWTCNRHIKARDTNRNNLIASLILPDIAAIQFQLELWKPAKQSVHPAIETLDATYCIIVWYSAIAPFFRFRRLHEKTEEMCLYWSHHCTVFFCSFCYVLTTRPNSSASDSWWIYSHHVGMLSVEFRCICSFLMLG